MKNQGIDHFINGIRKRVNLAIAWRVLSWILLALGLVLLVHAAIFRWKGEADC